MYEFDSQQAESLRFLPELILSRRRPDGTGVLATEDNFARFFNAMFEVQECGTELEAMIRKTVGKIDALRRINLEDARDRVVRICKRQAELDLLDRTEELASRWQRAQALRDYAMALDSSMAKELTTELDERPARVA